LISESASEEQEEEGEKVGSQVNELLSLEDALGYIGTIMSDMPETLRINASKIERKGKKSSSSPLSLFVSVLGAYYTDSEKLSGHLDCLLDMMLEKGAVTLTLILP